MNTLHHTISDPYYSILAGCVQSPPTLNDHNLFGWTSFYLYHHTTYTSSLPGWQAACLLLCSRLQVRVIDKAPEVVLQGKLVLAVTCCMHPSMSTVQLFCAEAVKLCWIAMSLAATLLH